MVKMIKDVSLPIRTGEELVITLEDGSRARTFPKEIEEVSLEGEGMTVIFSTKNSVYGVKILFDGFFSPQVIRRGEMVRTAEGAEAVEEILEVGERIVIWSRTGDWETRSGRRR